MNNQSFTILCDFLQKQLSQKELFVLAIDGFCASGKTTLAKQLNERFGGSIISMDDFFLPPTLRTKERLEEPGGNIHYERFLEEVIAPLVKGEAPTYSIFRCSKQDFDGEISIIPQKLLLIEGSYSMRPEFRVAYDASVFLSISATLQEARILARNGSEMLPQFLNRWIPFEHTYFDTFSIAKSCTFQLEQKDDL